MMTTAVAGDNDDNGDYDHPGHGRLLGANFWSAGKPFQRERTRSPPQRPHAAHCVWHHDHINPAVVPAVQLLEGDGHL
jgi:hypothetical protein